MILDIWSTTRQHIDIRLPKTSTKGFLSLLPTHIAHEQLISNLRAAVDYTYPPSKTRLPSLSALKSQSRTGAQDIHYLSEIFFTNYQDYETINQWLRLLESLRPELVKVVNLGKSHEGREILGITLNKPSTTGSGETKRAPVRGMVMHGAQHAREWISVSTVCYIAYQMIAGYYVDEKVRNLVDEFEWRYPIPIPPHIICCAWVCVNSIDGSFFPVLNADGYEYSWTTDRLWRKNRQPTQVAFCTGIDPDRSWAYKWDAPGSQPYPSNPCSESTPSHYPQVSVPDA
jgi:extracellular matrix protein 14